MRTSPWTTAGILTHDTPKCESLDSCWDFSIKAEGAPYLPPFIKKLPHDIHKADLKYLFEMGALTLPDTTLCRELLKSYLYYVHPYMPILDLREFLLIVARNDGVQQISLLLFQAVLLTGAVHVDLKYLLMAGYSDRRDTLRKFSRNAKVREFALIPPRSRINVSF